MELSQKQIDQFCYNILISDIKEYINSHLEEYKEFLKKYNNKKTK